jgi:hypothetical protein
VQAEVKAYLVAHPHIKTVVMAAFWSNYFRKNGPLQTVSSTGEAIEGQAAAQAGLRATLQWLRQRQYTVMLIGPVPAYDKSVPAALALEAATGRQRARSSSSEERLTNAPFLAVIDEFAPDARFHYVDPVPWLCAPQCRLIEDGVALYRDGHHLSVTGAMTLKGELSQAFSRVAWPPQAAVLPSLPALDDAVPESAK